MTLVSKNSTTYNVILEDDDLQYNVLFIDDEEVLAIDLDTGQLNRTENTEFGTPDFWAQDGANSIFYITLGAPPAPQYDQAIGKGGQAIGDPNSGFVIGKKR